VKLESQSFEAGGRIPAACAFAEPDPRTHFRFAGNRNPHLAWGGVPAGTRSFALLCVDPDAPSVGDDVNREGRSVPRDLPRADFVHWVLVDVPATVRSIAEGACSDGVTPGGKRAPLGPEGSRQGRNDYTAWFADDPELKGTYMGYDGPAPPWNDERVHRYRFRLYALGIERLRLAGEFSAADAERAMRGHVLAQAELVGTYTQNPALA
jgi:Raf kinase inhibitor-like YbhB/YbcL family protein